MRTSDCAKKKPKVMIANRRPKTSDGKSERDTEDNGSDIYSNTRNRDNDEIAVREFLVGCD